MSAVTATPLHKEVVRQRTTRERLLEAAIEMFAERGYAATGVDALCRRAGVAKTGLYWEFQNKVGLLNAVIDQVVAEWVDQIPEAARVPGGPEERLDAALGLLRRRVSIRPELFRVLLVVLAERAQIDEEAREALRRFHQSALSALRMGIREVVRGLSADGLRDVSEVIIAMIAGMFLRQQIYGEEDLDRLFEAVRSSIIVLVRHQKSAELASSPLQLAPSPDEPGSEES